MASTLEDARASQQTEIRPSDRRSHQRIRCRGTVELRRIPPAPPESICGQIENLSVGGCYVETERLLDVGERWVMEINLDGLQLRLIAEARSAKRDQRCWAGLEFVGISAEGLQKLKALIEALAKDQSQSPPSAKP